MRDRLADAGSAMSAASSAPVSSSAQSATDTSRSRRFFRRRPCVTLVDRVDRTDDVRHRRPVGGHRDRATDRGRLELRFRKHGSCVPCGGGWNPGTAARRDVPESRGRRLRGGRRGKRRTLAFTSKLGERLGSRGVFGLQQPTPSADCFLIPREQPGGVVTRPRSAWFFDPVALIGADEPGLERVDRRI